MSDRKLAEARLVACRQWSCATAPILSLVPVSRPGLGTLACDAQWRLYVDHAWLETVSIEHAAGLILHEVSHLLLRHHQRARGLVPERDEQAWRRWNQSTDLAINDSLQREGIALPDWLLFPSQFNLAGNQSAEWYFRELTRKQEQPDAQQPEQDQQGDTGDQPEEEQPSDAGDVPAQPDSPSPPSGQGEDQPAPGEPNAEAGDERGESSSSAPDSGVTDPSAEQVPPGTSGSCADGRQRPWEVQPAADDSEDGATVAGEKTIPPGIPEHVQEQLIQQTAQKIKSRGTQPGSVWGEFAESILNPKVDPRVLLMRAVRKAIEQIPGGNGEWTYRRPGRRPAAGGIVRPSPVQLIPRITLIVDSSGSMDAEDLGLALGMIGKVLNRLRLRDGVRVIVGDAAVQSAGQIFDPKHVQIAGRGGTDMSALIEAAAAETPTPDVIVCCSDGYTGWPEALVKPHVVVCLTREETRDSIPAWIQSIVLHV